MTILLVALRAIALLLPSRAEAHERTDKRACTLLHSVVLCKDGYQAHA